MLVKNFLFHRVANEKDKLWPPMEPALFSSIIRLLTKNYSVVPLESFLTDPAAFSSRKKLATVLFDDGYKDNIEVAAPILQQYKCPASFYIVTGSIDSGIPTWTYLVDHAIQHTKRTTIELDFDFVPEAHRTNQLFINGEAHQEVKKIKPWLKTLPNQQRTLVVDAILQQCSDVPPPAGQMMNWDDIRQLQSQGFYIGSHTHTHPMLASMESEEDIAFELAYSAERIQQETGTTAQMISYPIGSYDERVIRIAKQTGYRWGLAVEQKFFRYNDSNLMDIPRVELYQEPMWKARLRISGIYGHVKSLWS